MSKFITRLLILFIISSMMIGCTNAQNDPEQIGGQGSETFVPTDAPTNTATIIPSNTPTTVPTNTATIPPTNTLTSTATHTPTVVPTNTPTSTPTNTPTPTPTPTPTSTPLPSTDCFSENCPVLSIVNDTGGTLSIQLLGSGRAGYYQIARGSARDIPISPGNYDMDATATTCGSRTDPVSVAEWGDFGIVYFCQAASLAGVPPTPTPAPSPTPTPPPPTATASPSCTQNCAELQITNSTGGPLTISLSGSGRSEWFRFEWGGLHVRKIYPGYYTMTVTGICGSETVEVDVRTEPTYGAEYSCVVER